MVDYLREIVSGKKARFIDHETNLDLVYVTDRILMWVMKLKASSLRTDDSEWAGPLLASQACTGTASKTCSNLSTADMATSGGYGTC